MDDRFVNAPLATAMAMSKIDFDEMYAQTGITTSIIEAVRKLEKAGVEIMYPDKKKFENMVKPVYDYYRTNKEMDMLISQIKIQ